MALDLNRANRHEGEGDTFPRVQLGKSWAFSFAFPLVAHGRSPWEDILLPSVPWAWT